MKHILPIILVLSSSIAFADDLKSIKEKSPYCVDDLKVKDGDKSKTLVWSISNSCYVQKKKIEKVEVIEQPAVVEEKIIEEVKPVPVVIPQPVVKKVEIKPKKQTGTYKSGYSVGLYGKKTDITFHNDDIVLQLAGLSLSYKLRTPSSFVYKIRVELEKILSSKVNSIDSANAPFYANFLLGVEKGISRTVFGVNVGRESYLFKYTETSTAINYDTDNFIL